MDKKTQSPPHPGEILKKKYMLPRNISAPEMSARSGIPLNLLNKILDCELSVKLDEAKKLAMALNTNIRLWLDLQQEYDDHNAHSDGLTERKVMNLLNQICKMNPQTSKKAPTTFH